MCALACVRVCVCPHLHYLCAELRDELLLVGIYDSHLDQSVGLPVSAHSHQIDAGYRGGRMEQREEMKDTTGQRRKRIKLAFNTYEGRQQVEFGTTGFFQWPSCPSRRLLAALTRCSFKNAASAVNERGRDCREKIEVHACTTFFHFLQQRRLVSQRTAKHRKPVHAKGNQHILMGKVELMTRFFLFVA